MPRIESIVVHAGPQGSPGPQGNPGGPGTPKGTVATVGALPAAGNTLGDLYMVSGTSHAYGWNGTAWVDLGLFTANAWGTLTGTLSSQTDLNTALGTLTPGTAGYAVVGGTSGATSKVPSRYNVKAFGALGNGAADDATAFAAVTSAMGGFSSNGGIVEIPAGTYILGSQWLIPGNTIVRGVPGKTTIKVKGSVTAFAPISYYGGTNNVVLEDLIIDGNKSGTTTSASAHGISMTFTGSGATGMVVRRCTIQNCWQWGLRAIGKNTSTDVTTLPAMEVTIEDCTVAGCGVDGISLQYCTDSLVRNCRVSGSGQAGISVLYSRNVSLIGNHAHGNGQHGIVTEWSRWITAVGNVCTANTNVGLCFGGGSSGATNPPSRYITAVGNVCDGNQTGISCDPTTTDTPNTPIPQNLVLSGNVATNNTVHGMYLNRVQYATVTGNESAANGNAGIQGYIADVAIAGNHLHHNVNGLALTSVGGAGTARNQIGLNHIHDNTGTPVAIDANHTDTSVAPNPRINTVAASGAAQTLPHPAVYGHNDVTLTAACTLTFPAAAVSLVVQLTLRQDATGSRTVTWPGAVKWPGGTAPTLTATASKADRFSFACLDGTNWLGSVVGQNY